MVFFAKLCESYTIIHSKPFKDRRLTATPMKIVKAAYTKNLMYALLKQLRFIGFYSPFPNFMAAIYSENISRNINGIKILPFNLIGS